MFTLYFCLLLLAVVCFGVATIGVHSPRINLVALGLLCFVLVAFLKTLQKVVGN